jgi:hypothetical protein
MDKPERATNFTRECVLMLVKELDNTGPNSPEPDQAEFYPLPRHD